MNYDDFFFVLAGMIGGAILVCILAATGAEGAPIRIDELLENELSMRETIAVHVGQGGIVLDGMLVDEDLVPVIGKHDDTDEGSGEIYSIPFLPARFGEVPVS